MSNWPKRTNNPCSLTWESRDIVEQDHTHVCCVVKGHTGHHKCNCGKNLKLHSRNKLFLGGRNNLKCLD